MKKFINLSFMYALFALASGVFYREFTKLLGFSGRTTLAFTHLHLLVLGTLVFLIIGILYQISDINDQKSFKSFMISYNIGLPLMVVMFYVRGIFQTLQVELSKGISAAISGMSGIAHIIMLVAIVLLFTCLKKTNFQKQ
ncbi:MAG: DUF2871 domain-containing protein [Erysipelotrichaceae bacterium]